MDARAVVIGSDLALVADHPAIAIAKVGLRLAEWHHADHPTGWPCGMYCWPRYEPHYEIVHLDRLEKPGRERGLRPIAEAVLRWHLEVARRLPAVPIYSVVDMTGTDAWPLFDEILRRGPRMTLTGALITSGETPPSKSLGQRWLKVPRSALLANLETRLERQQVSMPTPIFDRVRGELLGVRRVVTPSRSIVYETVAQHDDLVLALALATWGEVPRPVAHAPTIFD